MKPELISKLSASFNISSDIAAALSFANKSQIGYWVLRARGLNCHRSHRALFNVLVDFLTPEAGHLYAERLAGLILAETLNPRRCKTCSGTGSYIFTPHRVTVGICPVCDGLGFHWLGERQIALLMGLSRHQIRQARYQDTIRRWSAVLMIMESETTKWAVID